MPQELPLGEVLRVVSKDIGGPQKIRPGVASVNDAGEWFTSARNWKFLEGALAYLNLTTNQPYADFPSDVMAIRKIRRNASFGGGFEEVSADQMLSLIEVQATSGTVNAGYYWGTVSHRQKGATQTLTRTATVPVAGETVTIDTKVYTWTATITSASVDGDVLIGTADVSLDNLIAAVGLTGTGGTDYASAMTRHATCSVKRLATTTAQAEALEGGEAGNDIATTQTMTDWTWGATTLNNGGGAPTMRLDLYPTPSADTISALVYYYRRSWATVSTDTTFISLPEWTHSTFLRACIIFARGYEFSSDNPNLIDQQLSALEAGPLWRACVRRDALVQGQYGTLRNGLANFGVSRRVRRGGWTTGSPS